MKGPPRRSITADAYQAVRATRRWLRHRSNTTSRHRCVLSRSSSAGTPNMYRCRRDCACAGQIETCKSVSNKLIPACLSMTSSKVPCLWHRTSARAIVSVPARAASWFRRSSWGWCGKLGTSRASSASRKGGRAGRVWRRNFGSAGRMSTLCPEGLLAWSGPIEMHFGAGTCC